MLMLPPVSWLTGFLRLRELFKRFLIGYLKALLFATPYEVVAEWSGTE